MASRILGPYRGRPFRTLVATAKILAAGHLGFTYFYSWSPVSGPSMLPFWEIWGNGAIVAHQYRRGRGIEVGDLVSFKVPTSNNPAIKRVAGLSGDYVLVHSPDKGRDEMIQVCVVIFLMPVAAFLVCIHHQRALTYVFDRCQRATAGCLETIFLHPEIPACTDLYHWLWLMGR